METMSGPNSFTRQFQSVSGIPRSLHSARTISSTSVAATTAFPAGNTQWIALNSLQARSVFSFIPPFPMITLTPVCFTNSYSNFSIRILVVGPTETISNLSFSRGRMIGPAWKMALFLTSTGSSLPSSTRRRCATSRQVVMLPSRYTISPTLMSFKSSVDTGVISTFFPFLISTIIKSPPNEL